MSASILSSVIQASIQAVFKVFVIALVGYFSALYPKGNPLIPIEMTGKLSRMTFNLLSTSLVYSTMAANLSFEVFSYLWFVPVAGTVVIITSFLTATLLGKLKYFRIPNQTDFDALRVAVSFPNIVALPLLIFPALCEYDIVYDSLSSKNDNSVSTAALSTTDKINECVAESNTMIFMYFVAWNFLFWTLGHHVLVSAGKAKQRQSQLVEFIDTTAANEVTPSSLTEILKQGLKATIETPGFVAMILGFITAAISPLQNALFSSGGMLRFLGSAIEAMAQAAPSLGTILVAASIVQSCNSSLQQQQQPSQIVARDTVPESDTYNDQENKDDVEQEEDIIINEPEADKDSGIQTQTRQRNTYTTKSSSLRQRMSSSLTYVGEMIRKPSFKMHVWFITTRLLICPAIICAYILVLDYFKILSGVPPLAKMLMLINSALPGALIVVVILKSRELNETATIVAKVYFPSYLISILTIAIWASVALYITIPSESFH